MRVRLLRLLRARSPRERFLLGVAASLALHLTLLAVLAVVPPLAPTWVTRRGDALFVELPNPEELAARGTPAPPGPPAVKPALAPPVAVRPVPAPRAAPPKGAAPSSPVEKTPAPLPQVADAPAPKVAAPEPAAPTTPAAPAPPAPGPTAGEPSGEPTRTAALPPAPAAPPRPPDGPGAVRAAPGGPEPPPDLRTALRGGAGGAQSRGEGRGGIEGEPVPLDSPDPRYTDYFDRVRRMIKAKWAYPCVKNLETRACEYRSGSLVIEFGIAKDGRVPFVTVLGSSGYPIMDDYAVNAVKLASPFPPVPDLVSLKGIPVLARFHYVVESSLLNLLR